MLFSINYLVGLFCFLFCAISGALIGLRFHHEDWLGGYQSFRRRLLRLGHIAFFGLGFLNIFFALCFDNILVGLRGEPSTYLAYAAALMLASGAVTMPLVCFLSAWKPAFRRVFFIPVIFTTGGIGIGVFLLTCMR
jgi:hypothetical protein